MKIPSVYKKGDLFFEIINAWNNLPEKNKRTASKAIYIKKRIKEFLKNETAGCLNFLSISDSSGNYVV